MSLKSYLFNIAIPTFGYLFRRRKKIKIIYFHDVVEDGKGYSYQHTDRNVFKAQMHWLKKHRYTSLLFHEIPSLLSKEQDEKKIIITFDDGFSSNYTEVYPFMRSLGLKFNIFLSPGYVDRRIPGYLTWTMIEEMAHSGFVAYGAHTYNHVDTRTITSQSYDLEIIRANQIIADHVGYHPTDFCFPYGYYDMASVSMLADRDIYRRLYTSDELALTLCNNCEIIGRTGIETQYSLQRFRHIVEGRYYIMFYYSGLRMGFPDVKPY